MSRLAPLLALLTAGCAGVDGGDAPSKLPDDTAPEPTCTAATYDVAPATWALPSGVAPGTFARAERDEADCAAGLPSTRLADLTGDGRPDLVALTDCEDADVGRLRWRVWPAADGGFGDEIAWPLPAGYGPAAFDALTRAAAHCETTDDLPAFFLADLDGDGPVDLAITDSCADTTLAAGSWRVHRSTGAGFEEAGVLRAIDTSHTIGTFVAPRSTAQCTARVDLPAWGLADLDGDGAADLVITDDCEDTDIRVVSWSVRPGGADGFAEAVAWGVPEEVGATALESASNFCPTSPAHFLLDLDGDARPELVTPLACSGTGSDWTAYPNEGAGHAPTPMRLRAPLNFNNAITTPENVDPNCEEADGAWSLADDDGDGLADLTLTSDCADVGETRWDRWPGSTEGWVDRVPVTLPASYSAGAFNGGGATASSCGGTANRPAWTRADLDGDGIAEIVVTEACDDGAVGTTSWRVHTRACVPG